MSRYIRLNRVRRVSRSKRLCYGVAMIFLDQSGRRWRRIKNSSAVMAIGGLVPVIILTIGSLGYHPSWAALSPVIKPIIAAKSVMAEPLVAAINNQHPKPTAPVISPSHAASKQLAAPKSSVAPAGAVVTTNSAATSAALQTTPTPKQSASTKPTSTPQVTPIPVKNAFGQGHNPKN